MYQYSTHRKKNYKIQYIVIGFLLLVGILVFVLNRFFFMKAGTEVRETAENILALSVSTATPKSVLIARQSALGEKIARLEQQLLTVQLLEDENRSLRELLSYTQNQPVIQVVARVIAKPSQNLYDRIILDQGSDNQISEGAVVIAGENILLARIDRIMQKSSEGLLFSGNFFSGDVIITRLGITVPVKGKGSGNFELYVPREIEIRDGDILTLPGYPQYIVGVVKSIQFDDRDPYQTVLARIPVNVQELKFVRIIQ